MPEIKYLQYVIELANEAVDFDYGGPFAAIVVKKDTIISKAVNTVYKSWDPTAHAEIEAIRYACLNLRSTSLEGCTLYSSCEPCPMGLSAIAYAKIKTVVYAASHQDACKIANFCVGELYAELAKSPIDRNIRHYQYLQDLGMEPFINWKKRRRNMINTKKKM